MKLNKYLIKVNYEKNIFIKKLNYYHLSFTKIGSYYLVSKNVYNQIKHYFPNYEIIIVSDYSVKGIAYLIKSKIKIIILLVLFGLLYLFFTNLIVRVDINTSDVSLKSNIRVSLKNYGIKPYSFKKKYYEINKIKKLIIQEYNEEIEWLEIKRIGMVYQIDLVKRINNQPIKPEEYCNIYAKKEGLITRVIYDQGELIVNQNDLVKKSDLLISGNIILNDELKAQVCARGRVYAEVWYTISLKIPIYEEKKIISKKNKYNLYYGGYNILKHQYSNYDVTTIKEIKNLKLVKETKVSYQKHKLTEEELLKKAFNIIKNKLDINLNKDYNIISQKVLKKSLNDSTMEMVVFISIEENIANQIIEMKE